MRYRQKKSSKPYRTKSPYVSKLRRYNPQLNLGRGYGGPRPYTRMQKSPYEISAQPNKSETKPHETTEHYTRERYEPEIERMQLQLNQLQSQMLAQRTNIETQSPKSEAEKTDSGLNFFEADSRKPFNDFDTLDQAESVFQKSREAEQTRIDNFMEWIAEVTQQPHPESLSFDDDPIEQKQIQTPIEQVSTMPPATLPELPTTDLDMLMVELYSNPVEAKKEVAIEQAENNVY